MSYVSSTAPYTSTVGRVAHSRFQDGCGTDIPFDFSIKTYAVQVGSDLALSINDGRVASQLLDLADDHDVLADVRVDQLAADAGR